MPYSTHNLSDEIMYIRTCVYSEDSDQPAHPGSLSRVFVVSLKLASQTDMLVNKINFVWIFAFIVVFSLIFIRVMYKLTNYVFNMNICNAYRRARNALCFEKHSLQLQYNWIIYKQLHL